MTERVDFYVLKHADARARQVFACRLAEKAYLKQLGVALLVADESQAREMDDLLWTFDDQSFVPHQLLRAGVAADAQTPVCVTLDPQSLPRSDLLLNLADAEPEALQAHARIAEILDQDPERLRRGRERFRIYRERKVALETHQIGE